MKGEFLVGAALGAAVVAACYSDTFRDTCKQTLSGLGEQVNKQISGFLSNLNGQPKEQTNDGSRSLAIQS